MNKVLLIGLDGATLDLIEPWAKEGQLPNLASLMAQGTYGRLASVMPVLSSAAWSSFMTGKNPGKHSIYDFVRRAPDSYRLRVVNHSHNRGDSLWKILSRHDRKVGVINVPMTYPPEEVNGFIVTGLGTPDYKTFTYPENLGKELLKRGYRVNKQVYYRPGNESQYLQELYDIAEKQFQATQWLLQTQDWDFFMVVFFDTDQMAHYFWRHMDSSHPLHNPQTDAPFQKAIQEYYQRMDAYIGALRQTAGEDANLIVISDHGTGPMYQDVFLNEWLRREGYLAIEEEVADLKGRYRFFGSLGLTRDGLSAFLRRNGLGRVERAIKDVIGNGIEFLPKTRRAEFPQAINWEKTRAYSFGYQGQIYLNVKGREPQGIVAPGEEYDQLRQEIIEKLGALTNPQDGKPVVDQVYKKEEVFQGSYTDFAPDLVLVMRGLSYNTRPGYEFSTRPGKMFSDPLTNESGSHRREGIFFAAGPDINPLGLQSGLRLVDVAPTVLHLLDCPIPPDMDGSVLEECLASSQKPSMEGKPSQESENPATPEELSDQEEQEMIDRLKNLGYL
jgi:predicted AlkP superfamily phosphohydrolase/phosphomutase